MILFTTGFRYLVGVTSGITYVISHNYIKLWTLTLITMNLSDAFILNIKWAYYRCIVSRISISSKC